MEDPSRMFNSPELIGTMVLCWQPTWSLAGDNRLGGTGGSQLQRALIAVLEGMDFEAIGWMDGWMMMMRKGALTLELVWCGLAWFELVGLLTSGTMGHAHGSCRSELTII